MVNGSNRPLFTPRQIQVDPVTLVRCRKRYLKAGDKDQYVEAMRNDGYDDVADVIIGKAVATNDPDPNWSYARKR